MEVESNSPRGTKRKTSDSSSDLPQKIRALSQDVVNKIAAGEIIVAPVHALKELIENSVDAGSTSLEILVKDGGLKLLQITDNGHGINKDDLSILCERFTTSKLKAFEDLQAIGTYGFRGEALASISHIAHLQVTTKTKESSCAWRAHYADGKLAPSKPGQSEEPKATAGRQGTQITVEDLFYNVPTRRRAFRSSSEEYAKILDLVGRYAIHCTGVAFSCKKHGEAGMRISVPVGATTNDRIRQIHGTTIANELIQLSVANQRWGFKCNGWVSNANCNVKRTTLLLFINHRSVESTGVKKAVEQTYSTFLPKGGHPFAYLSLEIDPARVDVNVHPTKREVNFLNEDEIIEEICDEIRASLGKVDTSRTFMTQTLLPGTKTNIPTISANSDRASNDRESPGSRNSIPRTPASKTPSQRPYDNDLVRTDSRVRKITSMLPPASHTPNSARSGPSPNKSHEPSYELTDKEPVLCRLTSIKELRASVRDAMHKELTDVIATHTFVGIIDETRRIAAIQGGVKLFLVDYGMLCNEYFYQLGLTDFGNLGTIRFEPALSLRELLNVGAAQERDAADENERNSVPWETVVDTVCEQLVDRRAMLAEYFALEISEEGELESIPLLIKGYNPSMAKLPRFLLNLGPRVNWEEEKLCFHSFLTELAAFYAPEPLPPPPNSKSANAQESAEGNSEDVNMDREEEDPEIASRRSHVVAALENTLFPAMKGRLVATKEMLKGVVEVANLKGLYRVFERC